MLLKIYIILLCVYYATSQSGQRVEQQGSLSDNYDFSITDGNVETGTSVASPSNDGGQIDLLDANLPQHQHRPLYPGLKKHRKLDNGRLRAQSQGKHHRGRHHRGKKAHKDALFCPVDDKLCYLRKVKPHHKPHVPHRGAGAHKKSHRKDNHEARPTAHHPDTHHPPQPSPAHKQHRHTKQTAAPHPHPHTHHHHHHHAKHHHPHKHHKPTWPLKSLASAIKHEQAHKQTAHHKKLGVSKLDSLLVGGQHSLHFKTTPKPTRTHFHTIPTWYGSGLIHAPPDVSLCWDNHEVVPALRDCRLVPGYEKKYISLEG